MVQDGLHSAQGAALANTGEHAVCAELVPALQAQRLVHHLLQQTSHSGQLPRGGHSSPATSKLETAPSARVSCLMMVRPKPSVRIWEESSVRSSALGSGDGRIDAERGAGYQADGALVLWVGLLLVADA